MGDPTNVSIKVSYRDEDRFKRLLNFAVTRKESQANGTIVKLFFEEFSWPIFTKFHFRGIPFVGFHGSGDNYSPRRMCGDGVEARDFECSTEGRLLVAVHETENGVVQDELTAALHYRTFEQGCRALITKI